MKTGHQPALGSPGSPGAPLTCRLAVALATLLPFRILGTQSDDGGDVDSHCVQRCDEERLVEPKEQHVELRTVSGLIWWTETGSRVQGSGSTGGSTHLQLRYP